MKLDDLLLVARERQVSDIYLLPNRENYQIKFHSQGQTLVFGDLNQQFANQLIATIKYRSEMNISEKRRPQLGRFTFANTWIRVSTVGDFLDRETLVLRLIYDQTQSLNWLLPNQLEQLKKDLPTAGLFLIAGPTGSGKTSTLYEVLRHYKQSCLILTIEDPVEIHEPDFVQLQVNETADVGYEELIKVALRHRPEILLVGEIRDGQTAKAAIQAALSGHLVLSTVHALSAADVRERLLELGVNPGQLDTALQGAVYQRLLPCVNQEMAALAEFWYQDGRSVHHQWQEGLNVALQKGFISPTTYQAFQKIEA